MPHFFDEPKLCITVHFHTRISSSQFQMQVLKESQWFLFTCSGTSYFSFLTNYALKKWWGHEPSVPSVNETYVFTDVMLHSLNSCCCCRPKMWHVGFLFNLDVDTLVCVLLLQWRCRKVNSTWECFSTLLCTGTSILCLSFSLCPRDFVCSQVRCGLLLDFHREHSALHPVFCSPHLCMCRTLYDHCHFHATYITNIPSSAQPYIYPLYPLIPS